MKINRIHVLVHPGYTLHGMGKHSILPSSESLLNQQEDLMRRYKKKVDSLKEDDVLVVFSPCMDYEYAKDYRNQEKWTQIERYAKKTLPPKNVIRLSNPSFLTPQEDNTSMSVLENILRKRGFEYTEETPCEIWGVSIASCVRDTALHFEQSGFTNIIIPSKTTDLIGRSREIDKLAEKLKQKKPDTKIKIENRS